MQFVPERRRSRRDQQRDPRGASGSEWSNWTGSRPAVVRRGGGTCFSSPSDDEVGGINSAIRARDVRAADLQEEPTNRMES
jgi:hypothetical protein